ncbi:MAG TPA: hypothetical protein P5509_06950 [Bacteroidales bacterium]|nr:hypothetical protein [Bacteroidales bacterium]
MKKRIPSFDDFVYEAVHLPDTKFVYKLLNKSKKQIMSAKNIQELDDIFNNLFNDRWILVNTSDTPDEECLFPRWSIDTANVIPSDSSPDGTILTLVLGRNIIDKIQGIKDKTEWKYFTDAVDATISHEYVHKYQIPKIPMDAIQNAWGGEISNKDYVMIKQEVMAFALQCTKEFMMKGYTPKDVLNKIKKPNIKTPPNDASDVWRTYQYFFKPNDDTWKRFTKYIFEYCMKFIKN